LSGSGQSAMGGNGQSQAICKFIRRFDGSFVRFGGSDST